MNRLLVGLCLCLLILHAWGGPQRFRIVTYNVENLFDTLHAEGKEDGEFTPTGSRQWTSGRYWGKLGKLCRVIAAVGGDTPADLVALVEVENDSVMHDLTQRTKLRRLGYDYAMAGTADVRGIGVGLLYQPHRFRPVSKDTLRFEGLHKRLRPTRHALHVAGELVTGDTLDVLVCHWPSRRGGQEATKFRKGVAQQLRTYCDSLLRVRSRAALVLMGDLNAWYPETCLREGLGCTLPEGSPNPRELYLLSHARQASHDITGTYKYQGRWNQLDHFIVNGRLLPSHTHRTTPWTDSAHCYIADLPFLLQKEPRSGAMRPYRTY
ncbi:MAG: endonuclease/exonuclease/phosphatase family protein, partial [Rothia sp. (in: high G+C Gram-positive bacteria)]|uniref:endonuclease/exonuclease/phosphatase family protein n=1 Tax=Rothia sp. (in: high G+C Gram-positive bacteria) TaxID=1885016 RepID=UPI0026E0BC9B